MKHLPVALLVLSLVACVAPSKNPPSLMRRAVEMRSDAVTPLPVAPQPKPIDASLSARITALLSEARLGDAEFEKTDATSGAEIRAGRLAKTGTETWIRGEQALSVLQSARQRSAGALAELDSLLIAQAQGNSADPALGGLADIRQAHAAVDVIVTRQTMRLDTLSR